MMASHSNQVAFQVLRGGRFSATVSPRAASQLVDAVMAVSADDLGPRFDREGLTMRLTSGQPMSQGDILSLLRVRPLLQNLGTDAGNALEQFERYVRERAQGVGNEPGSLRNPFHSIRVSPPKPMIENQAGGEH
jgi:hypothetical protein